MYQDSTSIGTEYQIGSDMVFGTHYVHNNLGRTIEDIGAVDARATRPTSSATPVRAWPSSSSRRAPRRSASRCRSRSASTTRSSSRSASAIRTTTSGAPATSTAASMATTRASRRARKSRTPTTGVSSATAQQQAGSIARPGGNANRAWDIDELFWDSHGTLDVLGRLPTDRPHVVKLYGCVHGAVRHAVRRRTSTAAAARR